MRSHLFHAHLAAAALALTPVAAHAADEAKPVKLVYRDIPPEAQENPLDVNKATRAYLNMVSPEAHAKSDAYFEGGYWLQLWNFLINLGITVLLLQSRFSGRMRSLSEWLLTWGWLRRLVADRGSLPSPLHLALRLFNWWLGFIRPALYWFQYFVVAVLLSFPFDVYVGYFREHQYNLSNLTFGGWMGEQAKGLLLGMFFGALALPLLYAVLRKVRHSWWIWASGVVMALAVFAIVISPVFVEPVFNKFRPVQDQQVREQVLRLARANGIPATDVSEYDASKQSDRVSAHVSGFLGTTRISLNDNLLERCNLAQIESVMAHEMGHYVFNHVLKMVLFLALLTPLAFAFAQWAFRRLVAARGEKWDVRGIDDPAGFPLVMAVLSTFFFVLTPVMNSMVRSQEMEADQFALNAAYQPDAEAQVDLSLGEYRKLDPGRLEEIIFYDHPSGRVRIETAMRWKAEHLQELKALQAATPTGTATTDASVR